MLFDFICVVCNHTFEDLINSDENNPVCPLCHSETEKGLNTPAAHSPKYWEMHRKSVLMKKRMTGQLPWRRSSESQTD